MKSLKLKDNFYWIGIQDPDLRVFDIIMETKFGTTYNSYLLKTNEGVVLFETAKVKFFDDYIEKIKEYCAIEDIKYIIVEHTEPDHSGSIEKLLELNPNITIISTMIAANYLKEITNKPFQSKTVKDNEELTIGEYSFKFLTVPNLHWPDTMYTYIQELKTLVTCDSFGSHYSHEGVLLSNVENKEDYKEALDYYFNMILGPFKPFVLKALTKIENLEIDLIAPGHGPVLDEGIQEIQDYYKKLCQPKVKSGIKVVIPYVSAYGYTKMIAETIKTTLESENINVSMYDLVESDKNKVIQEMKEADGILYGCPTLLNDALPPIYEVMNSILASYDGAKIVSAFGSYGWTGEAVPNMLARLKQQKHKVVDEGYRVKFKPSEAQIEEIKQYALNYASKLK